MNWNFHPGRHTSALSQIACRVQRHVGRRGAFLLFLALLDATTGYALGAALPPGLDRHLIYQPFETIAPIAVWQWWWYGTGLLAAAAAAASRIRPAVFGLAACLKVGWACGYVIGWLSGLPVFVRGYQTAAVWFAFAAVVLVVSGWRENTP